MDNTRRIKRHVWAPTFEHLAVVQPALTALAAAEAEAAGLAEVTASAAGVSFTGRLSEAYRANLLLRCPGRIYTRVAGFRAGAREELFRRTATVPWELWLRPATPLRVEARVLGSRLRHEGRAAEAVAEAVARRLTAGAPTGSPASEARDAPPPQRLLLRLADDQAELSLDTSGALLHERGYGRGVGPAPIRDTLAAALLRATGWQGDTPVLDGMCGSGTFLLEALLVATGIPPGAMRSFAFETWACFREATWTHLRRHSLTAAAGLSPPPLLGLDLDPNAITCARDAVQRLRALPQLAARLAQARCELREADFFAFRPADEPYLAEGGLLILNPPYGRRLGGQAGPLFTRLGDHLRQHYRGWRALLLCPDSASLAAVGIAPLQQIRLRHGGLRVIGAVLEL